MFYLYEKYNIHIYWSTSYGHGRRIFPLADKGKTLLTAPLPQKVSLVEILVLIRNNVQNFPRRIYK